MEKINTPPSLPSYALNPTRYYIKHIHINSEAIHNNNKNIYFQIQRKHLSFNLNFPKFYVSFYH